MHGCGVVRSSLGTGMTLFPHGSLSPLCLGLGVGASQYKLVSPVQGSWKRWMTGGAAGGQGLGEVRWFVLPEGSEGKALLLESGG